jgi:hypothetical protein
MEPKMRPAIGSSGFIFELFVFLAYITQSNLEKRKPAFDQLKFIIFDKTIIQRSWIFETQLYFF